MPIGTIMLPSPARNGSASLLRARSSPMSNSRRVSSPTTRKKSAIRPEFTNSRRSIEMLAPRNAPWSSLDHTRSYDESLIFAQISAATVAPARMAALPVSVFRNWRSGVCRLLAHAVVPENGEAAGWASVMTKFSVSAARASER